MGGWGGGGGGGGATGASAPPPRRVRKSAFQVHTLHAIKVRYLLNYVKTAHFSLEI